MALAEVMYWNTHQKRWFKKYLGRMYAVSPKQLDPLTKYHAMPAAWGKWVERLRTQRQQEETITTTAATPTTRPKMRKAVRSLWAASISRERTAFLDNFISGLQRD